MSQYTNVCDIIIQIIWPNRTCTVQPYSTPKRCYEAVPYNHVGFSQLEDQMFSTFDRTSFWPLHAHVFLQDSIEEKEKWDLVSMHRRWLTWRYSWLILPDTFFFVRVVEEKIEKVKANLPTDMWHWWVFHRKNWDEAINESTKSVVDNNKFNKLTILFFYIIIRLSVGEHGKTPYWPHPHQCLGPSLIDWLVP